MDRDAPVPPPDDILPPPDPAAVYRQIGIGAGVCVGTAVLGIALDASNSGGPGPLSAARVLLTFAGLVVAGVGLSRRPLPLAWLLAAVAALSSRLALPEHWDSFRMLVTVGGVLALIGAALAAIVTTFRYAILSALAVVHFGGILCATTWPETHGQPPPWLTVQVGTRVYLPYLMFMYLRNAYHFYSPEPGPASHLFCLVEYEEKDDKGKHRAEWMTLPDRAKHLKDPLALAYFRRLAITEQVSQGMPDAGTFERRDVEERRLRVAGANGGYPNYPQIPLAPDEIEPRAGQYRLPRADILRYLLPSYAHHILTAAKAPGKTPRAVKLYRLEHRTLSVHQFAKGKGWQADPHHPTGFRPYFYGEFVMDEKTGKAVLNDPQDPMLYWLVPIIPRPPTPGTSEPDYADFLSKHAGYAYDWKGRTP